MTQQGSLFAPKPQPSGEGRYYVAIKDGQRWLSVSRDHRFPTAESAQVWLETQRHLWIGKLEVKLLEEINKI